MSEREMEPPHRIAYVLAMTTMMFGHAFEMAACVDVSAPNCCDARPAT